MSTRVSIESGSNPRIFSADYADNLKIFVGDTCVYDSTLPTVRYNGEDFTGHTPGPWGWEPDDNLGGFRGITSGVFDKVLWPKHNRTLHIDEDAMSAADRRLIAAAPDLLAERDRLRVEKAELVELLKRAEYLGAWTLPQMHQWEKDRKALLSKHETQPGQA